ncbi:Hypp4685 [Branchiostoma lanceolatum]|uniref:Hypp4685 protein n=1 Tax=Branchiostoma lanceolatum TaxID=7740 RepID=A0A8K0ACT7_BRALA|nr:Hypp4685 [Branchiostoma lanceolatum]
MKITIGTILAVVSLPCCLQSTYAQSPALTEFVNYFVGLEKNKPIDWQSTLYFLNTGQLDPTCYNQAYTVHNDTILTKSYAANSKWNL